MGDVRICYVQGRIACTVIGAVRANRLRKLSFTKKKSQNSTKKSNWVCVSFLSFFVFFFFRFRNMAHTCLVFLKKRAALKKYRPGVFFSSITHPFSAKVKGSSSKFWLLDHKN